MEAIEDFIFVMRDRIETLIANGKWDEAKVSAESTLETFTEKYEQDSSHVGDYCRALEIRANLYRDQGEIEEAERLYTKIVELLRYTPGFPGVCGRVGANLAMIYEDKELLDEARSFYLWSLENLEITDPPLQVEMAGVLNNLAYLYETEHFLDKAEELFLRALSINKAELGKEHEATADVYNNLGGLYYRSENYGQALEMHKMALSIRKDALGKKHLDTAQSYGNIALIYAELEKIEIAKESFDSALKIMEKSDHPDVHHYAIVSANFSHVLKEQGHLKDAEKIAKRTSKFLKKQ